MTRPSEARADTKMKRGTVCLLAVCFALARRHYP